MDAPNLIVPLSLGLNASTSVQKHINVPFMVKRIRVLFLDDNSSVPDTSQRYITSSLIQFVGCIGTTGGSQGVEYIFPMPQAVNGTYTFTSYAYTNAPSTPQTTTNPVICVLDFRQE